MGECLIMRRGGETKKVPILDPNYPEDVSLIAVGENTESATFAVVISEPGNPAEYTYQWYVNDTPITDATGATYTMTDLLETATYSVYCEVRNKAGVVNSRIATLNVVHHYVPVLDASYPVNTTVVFDQSVTNEVKIAENGNPAEYTYQWYVNDTPITGATSDTYTFTPGVSGSFTVYCEVTNAAGTVTSRTATITVEPVYLYKSGNENTSITGGLTAYAYGPSTSSASRNKPKVTEFSDHIELWLDGSSTGSAGSYFAENKVDLTKLKTLYVTVKSAKISGASSDSCYIRFGVSSTKADKYTQTAATTIFKGNGSVFNETFSLSVEDLSGSYYLFINMYGGGEKLIKFTEWRLE